MVGRNKRLVQLQDKIKEDESAVNDNAKGQGGGLIKADQRG